MDNKLLNINKYYDSLPWIEAQRRRFSALVATGQCHHALLLQGPAGAGRRHLALWIAKAVLGHTSGLQAQSPAGTEDLAADPDYWEILPEEMCAGEPEEVADRPDSAATESGDESSAGSTRVRKPRREITVDQIRNLVARLSLTQHGNAGRVVVLYPAERMNRNAANSLLKTLEEPPAGTVMLLIAETLGSLPRTIISRCQLVRVSPPDRAAGLAWLQTELPGEKVDKLLDFCGGAPLLAADLAANGFLEFAREFLGALQRIERREASPLAVAASVRDQADTALQLLEWRLAERLRAIALVGFEFHAAEVRAAYDQLARIRELRRVINRGINAELSLAGILFDWYGGLGHQREVRHG